MNLKSNPDKNELRTLLDACDDNAGHHVIWVDHEGEVHSTLLVDLTPAGFEMRLGSHMKFRYESLQQGNGYVGPEAAKDDFWVSILFDHLTSDWAQDRNGLIDYWPE